MNESNRRTKRIAQLIWDHVARYLVSHVGDKRLTQVVISNVRVSDDLSIAWLSVRMLVSQGSEAERKQCVKQLQLLAGRLRKTLSPVLGVRRIPELRFAFDEGLDAQHRVEEILHEIVTERSPKS